LSDIADAEDFAGDMDFKVTGTSQGITALQMDMKVHGLPVTVLRQALDGAKPGREHILQHMQEIIDTPRVEISKFAPQIDKIKINPEKIGAIIGKGGEMINKITAETGAEIDINDDGLITVAASDAASIKKALDWIESLTEEPEVGRVYEGKVVSVKDFGAFVNIMPGIDGMVHVSEISEERVENVSDKLKEGQMVSVKLIGIDERGRLSLSMKEV
jgi:polyribonucleotide nucleotidyltransferase